MVSSVCTRASTHSLKPSSRRCSSAATSVRPSSARYAVAPSGGGGPVKRRLSGGCHRHSSPVIPTLSSTDRWSRSRTALAKVAPPISRLTRVANNLKRARGMIAESPDRPGRPRSRPPSSTPSPRPERMRKRQVVRPHRRSLSALRCPRRATLVSCAASSAGDRERTRSSAPRRSVSSSSPNHPGDVGPNTLKSRRQSGMLGLERHRLVFAAETRRARVDDDLAPIRRARELMTVLRILLAILYLACRVYSGPATLRGGHLWLFWIGSLFPLLPREDGARGGARSAVRELDVRADLESQLRFERWGPWAAEQKVISGYARWHQHWVVT